MKLGSLNFLPSLTTLLLLLEVIFRLIYAKITGLDESQGGSGPGWLISTGGYSISPGLVIKKLMEFSSGSASVVEGVAVVLVSNFG